MNSQGNKITFLFRMNLTPRNTFPTKDNNAITYLFSKRPRGVIIEYGGVVGAREAFCVSVGVQLPISLEISGLAGRIDGTILHHLPKLKSIRSILNLDRCKSRDAKSFADGPSPLNRINRAPKPLYPWTQSAKIKHVNG